MDFEFIETEVCARQIQAILEDEEYGHLQVALIENPYMGDVIPGWFSLNQHGKVRGVMKPSSFPEERASESFDGLFPVKANAAVSAFCIISIYRKAKFICSMFLKNQSKLISKDKNY